MKKTNKTTKIGQHNIDLEALNTKDIEQLRIVFQKELDKREADLKEEAIKIPKKELKRLKSMCPRLNKNEEIVLPLSFFIEYWDESDWHAYTETPTIHDEDLKDFPKLEKVINKLDAKQLKFDNQILQASIKYNTDIGDIMYYLSDM